MRFVKLSILQEFNKNGGRVYSKIYHRKKRSSNVSFGKIYFDILMTSLIVIYRNLSTSHIFATCYFSKENEEFSGAPFS